MERHLYLKLTEWRIEKNRKPLLLYGARQTGKTYLLTAFGQTEFSALHYINFEQDPEAIKLFAGHLSPKTLIPLIELYLDSKINPESDLLFFDEIQECPRAVTSLKYFYEDIPQMAVCGAGSYMGLLGTTESFPVGKVHTLTLYPMSFSEFLQALQPALFEYYASFIESPEPLPLYIHEQLWNTLLLYYFTGGMPEAVRTLLESSSRKLNAETKEKISVVHAELLTGYRSDFATHSGTINANHIYRVFEQVPIQLSKDIDGNAQRFTFKGAVPKAKRYRDLAGAIDWLKATGLVYASHIIDSPEIPFGAHSRESIFKLYLFDIGLLHHMLGISATSILSMTYGSYKGYIAENFTAAQLVTAGIKELYTWKENTSEIEYVVLLDDHVVPVEVKSGSHTRRAKSLQVFRDKYEPTFAVKISARNFSQQDSLVHIPLYAAGDLHRVIANI
ncbi:MAG: AAA family ATPase [Spirochaetia bacterium]|nr:AAA family ATPase [Spirochaetia bacterium]